MLPFTEAGPAGSRPPIGRRSPVTSPTAINWCQSRVLLALGLVFCGSATTAHSQTPLPEPVWESASDALMDTNVNAQAGGIAADGMGTVFVAGSRTDSAGISYGVIRKSTDQGDTWTDADVEVVGAQYQRIGSRGASTIAASPYGGVCLVRGTEDGGATWSDLVRFTHPNPNYAIETIWDVEIDQSGNIYVVTNYTEKVAKVVTVKKGKTTTTTTTYTYPKRYVILKYAQGPDEWTPILSTFPITKVVCAGSSDVYCIDNTSWNVRKSTDGGINWLTLDSWQFETDIGTYATDIAIDGSGKLYVTGTGRRIILGRINKFYPHWIVRHQTVSADGIWTWATDTIYAGAENTENVATAVTVGANDNVHVVGKIGIDGLDKTAARWLTREYSPSPVTGAWSWKTTDVIDQVSWGYGAYGNRITADPDGNVFAKGGTYWGEGWTLRRKLALPPPSSTVVPE